MSIRSTHVHAPAREFGVAHATAVALGASGMDSGSTWHDLETGPAVNPNPAVGLGRPRPRFRDLFPC